MAVNVMLCRSIPGLFGPESHPAPIWGDRESLACLANTIETGLSISEQTSTTGQSEATHAIQLSITRLQQAGRIPDDLFKIQNLSDDQRSALGFEPRALPPGSSMQDWGVPPFQKLDLADFLAALRFVSRHSELKSGYKPVFQVGILTMIAQDVDPEFFAQLFVSDAGLVTDTIWLYRWCVVSSDDGGASSRYAERWRAFDIPAIAQQQDSTSPQDLLSIKREPPSLDHTQATLSPSTNPIPTPSPDQKHKPTPLRRKDRPLKPHRPEFPHAHLSDSQLFALDPDRIQGAILLRLAQSHSNQAIYERINAEHQQACHEPHHQPRRQPYHQQQQLNQQQCHIKVDADEDQKQQQQQQRIKSVNVITKRLTQAIKSASRASGRSERAIRLQLAEAKRSRGVAHKGKVDVGIYG